MNFKHKNPWRQPEFGLVFIPKMRDRPYGSTFGLAHRMGGPCNSWFNSATLSFQPNPEITTLFIRNVDLIPGPNASSTVNFKKGTFQDWHRVT